MTPAITAAKRGGIGYSVHEYRHDPAAPSYGLEAAEGLGVSPLRVFKTLVVQTGGPNDLAVGVVPVARQLDLKALAAALGVKKAAMARAEAAQRATGYVLGGISPLGQKKSLSLRLDTSAEGFDTIFVSAGRRGLEIALAPADLLRLTGGRFAAIACD